MGRNKFTILTMSFNLKSLVARMRGYEGPTRTRNFREVAQVTPRRKATVKAAPRPVKREPEKDPLDANWELEVPEGCMSYEEATYFLQTHEFHFRPVRGEKHENLPRESSVLGEQFEAFCHTIERLGYYSASQDPQIYLDAEGYLFWFLGESAERSHTICRSPLGEWESNPWRIRDE